MNSKTNYSPYRRASIFTQHEREVLMDIVRQKYPIILDKKLDAATNNKKKEAWIRVARDYNKIPTITKRLVCQLKNAFRNMRTRQNMLRKQNSSNNNSFKYDPLEQCGDEIIGSHDDKDSSDSSDLASFVLDAIEGVKGDGSQDNGHIEDGNQDEGNCSDESVSVKKYNSKITPEMRAKYKLIKQQAKHEAEIFAIRKKKELISVEREKNLLAFEKIKYKLQIRKMELDMKL